MTTDIATRFKKTTDDKPAALAPVPPLSPLAKRARDVIKMMEKANPERGDIIRALVTALFAGQHVLVLGEPGTGKSRLANQLSEAISARSFSYLMTRFTEPAELFGSVNVKVLADEGRIKLNTAGRITEADIAFLDEVFKSNSAILNSLLTLVNERRYFDDGAWHTAPLRFLVAASNEVPEEGDNSVAAFYDRILVRLVAEPLQNDANFFEMLLGTLGTVERSLSVADLDAGREEARKLPVDDVALHALAKIRRALRAKSVIVSDRRWVQVLDFLRAHAWLNGEDRVSHGTVSILAPCLWSRPEQIPTVEEIVKAHAPSHETELRAINQVLAEQSAVIARVDGMVSKQQAMEAIGGIQSALDDVEKDLAELEKKTPAAKAGVAQARATVEDVRSAALNKSIAVQKAKKS